jgi:hypothetical protein
MGYGAGWIGSSFGWLTNPQDASGGTVSSVGLSMPSAFTVTNSPVTTTGILTVTGSGTTSQFIDGTGALQLIPSLSGEQGYWGAFYDLSATQQALSTTVAYAINIGQSDPLNNGVSIVSGNRITFAPDIQISIITFYVKVWKLDPLVLYVYANCTAFS